MIKTIGGMDAEAYRILFIHKDVMYAGFAGAKTGLAPYLRPCRQRRAYRGVVGNSEALLRPA